MAKTSPGEFIRQVRAEIGKVVWPTRQETTQTAIMVLIMTIILAVFFLGVDAVGIGRDRLVGVTDMRRPVRVGDRCGDVERRLGRHLPIQHDD